jgi:membrane associated rhomboid family serine protease
MTLALLVLNLAAFVLQAAYPQQSFELFALWPPTPAGIPSFHAWQLVTYSALHANLTHLVVDVTGLYLFGRDIELALGRLRLAALYLSSVIAGGLVQWVAASVAVSSIAATGYPSVGAAAGLFGVLLTYAVLFPERRVMPLLPFLPMPARYFAIGYAALALLLSVSGAIPGMVRYAHLGGIAGAAVCLLYWSHRPRRPL